MSDPYLAKTHRYDEYRVGYRRAGRSGLLLPQLSLGLWQNFGDTASLDRQRAILRRAFDLGITHFDLANNYGPPYGSAESNFGHHLAADFKPYRDELVITSKAGYDMWPGPYGDHGSRKYLISSLDQSLKRLGLDYVDVFYHHRPDTETPIEETMGALADIVRTGKALYVAVSNYSPAQTRNAHAAIGASGGRLVLHQPRYSMFDRHIEDGLLDTTGELGLGTVVFSPLAQGLLTDRYLHGIPDGSRATHSQHLSRDAVTKQKVDAARQLNDIAATRGQTLAQLALAWVLRDARVTSAIIGASSVEQLDANVRALENLEFDDEGLLAIDDVLRLV